MPRLRRADCTSPGITRLRQGRGFRYRYADGIAVRDEQTLQRIAALAIPPAWTDVWICSDPQGHLQATGTDAAGRRQYRYHDGWRAQRDRDKHDRVVALAARLPAARQRIAADLSGQGLTRERVLATAARLLDLGFFRVGGEEYAERNGSYGLATLQREHARIEGQAVVFEYRAKSGQERLQAIVDPEVRRVVAALRRQAGSGKLLGYRSTRGWVDVRSDDINDYLKEVTGGDWTAKDFRTWHATVLAAVALAVSTRAPSSPTARRAAVRRAIAEVAHYLGNTPAVCRSSYVDPRVVDCYLDGVTIVDRLTALGADARFGELATQGPIEEAVLRLLANGSPSAVRTGRPARAARPAKPAGKPKRTAVRAAHTRPGGQPATRGAAAAGGRHPATGAAPPATRPAAATGRAPSPERRPAAHRLRPGRPDRPHRAAGRTPATS